MNKTCEEVIEIIAAIRDKKTIQWQRDGLHWMDHTNIQSWEIILELFKNGYDLRVKPAPTKRLIRADEMGNVIWFRVKDGTDTWHQIVFVSELGYISGVNGISKYWSGVENDFDAWSPDRKEVKSFYTEEDTK